MTQDNDIGALRDALFDAALDRALDPMPIAPVFRKAVRALLRETKHIELAGGVVLADGQPLGDAVRSWCCTDAAKPFLAAPSSGSGHAPAPTGLRKSAMTNAQKGAYLAAHGYPAYERLPT